MSTDHPDHLERLLAAWPERDLTVYPLSEDDWIVYHGRATEGGMRKDLSRMNEAQARLIAAAINALPELIARVRVAEMTLAELREWTHQHGRALCPPGADAYGEGMRDAKAQVDRLLAARGDTP